MGDVLRARPKNSCPQSCDLSCLEASEVPPSPHVPEPGPRTPHAPRLCATHATGSKTGPEVTVPGRRYRRRRPDLLGSPLPPSAPGGRRASGPRARHLLEKSPNPALANPPGYWLSRPRGTVGRRRGESQPRGFLGSGRVAFRIQGGKKCGRARRRLPGWRTQLRGVRSGFRALARALPHAPRALLKLRGAKSCNTPGSNPPGAEAKTAAARRVGLAEPRIDGVRGRRVGA